MPTYNYKARDRFGTLISGKREANSMGEVGKYLSEKGYFVVSLKKDKEPSKLLNFFKKKVKDEDMLNLFRQLSVLIKGGIPITGALETIEMQLPQSYFKTVVFNLKENIKTGTSLSDSMGAYPDVFKPVYINMIEASEMSGQLEQVLEKLAILIGKQQKLKSQLKTALTYPITVFSVAVTVVIFILVAVLPKFIKIFASKKGLELPMATKILIFISSFLTNYGYMLIIGIILFIWIFKKLCKNENFLNSLHRVLLKVPVFGEIYYMSMLANFASTIGFMYKSGVPLLRALQVAQKIINNKIFYNVIKDAINSVEYGDDLSNSLERSKFFPPTFTKMVSVGEKTGKLDELLLHISNHLDEEIDTKVKRLSSVIEPIMILVVGVIVGFIVLSVLMPMFQMIKSFK